MEEQPLEEHNESGNVELETKAMYFSCEASMNQTLMLVCDTEYVECMNNTFALQLSPVKQPMADITNQLDHSRNLSKKAMTSLKYQPFSKGAQKVEAQPNDDEDSLSVDVETNYEFDPQLKLQLEKTTEELNEERKKNLAMESKCETLLEKLEKVMKMMESQKEQFEGRIRSLSDENESLKDENEALRGERDQLRQEISGYSVIQNRNDPEEQQMKFDRYFAMKHRESELLELKDRYTELRSKLERKEAEVLESKEMKSSYEAELKSKEGELVKVKSMEECQKKEIAMLQARVEEMKEDLQGIRKEKEILFQNFAKLSEDNSNIRGQLFDFQKETMNEGKRPERSNIKQTRNQTTVEFTMEEREEEGMVEPLPKSPPRIADKKGEGQVVLTESPELTSKRFRYKAPVEDKPVKTTATQDEVNNRSAKSIKQRNMSSNIFGSRNW